MLSMMVLDCSLGPINDQYAWSIDIYCKQCGLDGKPDLSTSSMISFKLFTIYLLFLVIMTPGLYLLLDHSVSSSLRGMIWFGPNIFGSIV